MALLEAVMLIAFWIIAALLAVMGLAVVVFIAWMVAGIVFVTLRAFVRKLRRKKDA